MNDEPKYNGMAGCGAGPNENCRRPLTCDVSHSYSGLPFAVVGSSINLQLDRIEAKLDKLLAQEKP